MIEKMEKSKTQLNGGVAQLGEHLPCKQGVMGSNPIISTKEMLGSLRIVNKKARFEVGAVVNDS